MNRVAGGASDYAVAAQTGVPWATVRRWRLSTAPPLTALRNRRLESWRVEDAEAYCYLLGVYLGDGTVWIKPPSYVRSKS